MTIAHSPTFIPVISPPAEAPIALRKRWQRLLSEISHPAVELTLESFAPFMATYQAMRKSGEQFDRAFSVLMEKLREQMSDESRDGCSDGGEDVDDRQYDDPDDDAHDYSLAS